MSQADSAKEQDYIQMGPVWLAFKELMKEHEELSPYLGNIAFSLSSRVGWDIRDSKTEFYYPSSQDQIHPFNLYIPVEHAAEKLESAGNFTFAIRNHLKNRHDEPGPLGKLIGGMLSKIFTGSSEQKPRLSREDIKKEKIIGLLDQALEQNKDKIANGQKLESKGWKHFDPAAGRRSPFFLSAKEQGTGFDFTMRRN